MNAFSRDVRFSWRMIRKSPGFSLVVVLTLALGIGANTAIFTLVNAVILRPLPFPEPGELMVLNEYHESIAGMSVAYLNFLDWRKQNSVFERLVAHRNENYNLTGVERPVRVKASQVSAGFFEILGASPRLGRTFTEADDKPGAERVAVLTHGLWVSLFGEDPAILSRTIQLDGETYTVIGVAPPGFDFALSDTDSEIYVPIGLNEDRWQERGNHPGIYVLGRLRGGVSPDTARENMAAIAKRLEEAYPDTNTGNSVRIRSLYEVAVRPLRTPLLILLAAVGFVLLIACGNVANLLLVRASTRTPEIAVRTAIGASRFHVARQLLTESLLLAALGGVLGVLMGVAATRGLLALLPANLPRLDEVSIDLRVLGFTAALCLLTGVLFGLAPAIAAVRVNLQTMLKEGGRSGVGGRHYLRRFLIGFEVAMAVVLLVGASLMIRSLYNVLHADPGFDPHNVLTLQFSLPRNEYPESRHQTQFVERLLRSVRSLPGVEAAGVATPLLGGWQSGIYVEGEPIPKPGETHLAAIGLYGLLSYSVAQRYQEIGLRMALGADRGAVLWNFVSQGLKLSGAGLAAGLGASFAANRLLESQLFGVKASDALSFTLMALLLLAVAVIAAYLPARRAASVDPMVALRYE